MRSAVIVAPLRLEALAARLGTRGRPGVRVEVTGMGPRRAGATAARLGALLASEIPVGLVGFAGGLDRSDRPGDLVVASELEALDGSVPTQVLDIGLAERVRARLAAAFQRVRLGRIVCSPTLLGKNEMVALAGRRELKPLACEMESAWLAPLSEGRPFVVVRTLVDRPGRPLFGPWTIGAGTRAIGRLVAAAGLVAEELVAE